MIGSRRARSFRFLGWQPGAVWDCRDWRIGVCVHRVAGGTVIFFNLPCLVLGLRNFSVYETLRP